VTPLVEQDERGLFCRQGDLHIDPWAPVDRALITHAHGDHARMGSRRYLCSAKGASLLRERLGDEAVIESLPYGDAIHINGVAMSFHPSGHMLGASQIRLEHKGEICVISGDYKTEADGLCDPFEPLRCHMFLTESTFGLPVYRWRPQAEILEEINTWWRANRDRRRTSILFAYSLGKAQRVLAGLNPSIGPILLHGAVARYLPVHEFHGFRFPPCHHATDELARASRGKAIVLAPPSAQGTPWIRKFGDSSTAFVSGWMRVRGNRRRKAVDRGFVLSDHADWDGLNQAVAATGAEAVGVTHGYTLAFARWLSERGLKTSVLQTRSEGELDSQGEP